MRTSLRSGFLAIALLVAASGCAVQASVPGAYVAVGPPWRRPAPAYQRGYYRPPPPRWVHDRRDDDQRYRRRWRDDWDD
jgi:hypothetical protein